MAARKLKKKKNNEGLNIDEIKGFCIRYKKYFATGALLVLLAVVVAGTAGKKDGAKGQDAKTSQTTVADETGTGVQQEEFEVDGYEEINSLIADYYGYYAAGDTASLEKIAYPVSDTEKSYIESFSKYVESYDDITCYTKKGINEGDFVVSVSLDMKFKNIKTGAPGLDFFYVRKNDKGAYYIDNAYSQFNQSNQENTTDLEINTLITEFEQDEDVIALQKDVQSDYEKAVASDKDLKKMVEKTVPDAIVKWVAGFSDDKDASDDKKNDDTKKDDAKADDTKTDDKKEDDADSKDSDSDSKDADSTKAKTRTAYAKTKVNLRHKMSIKSKVVKTLKAGTKLTVYGKSEDGWFKVKCGGRTGYIKKYYVVFDKSDIEKESDKKTDTGSVSYLPEGKQIILSESTNVRKSMSETADRVGLAYQGDTVTVIMSYEEGWTKVSWNGETGYVKTEFLK